MYHWDKHFSIYVFIIYTKSDGRCQYPQLLAKKKKKKKETAEAKISSLTSPNSAQIVRTKTQIHSAINTLNDEMDRLCQMTECYCKFTVGTKSRHSKEEKCKSEKEKLIPSIPVSVTFSFFIVKLITSC